MKYLKDIPGIHDSENIDYLKSSQLWETPIRFIKEETLEDFYATAKKELTEERAGGLVSHIVACSTLAQFLGMTDHVQFKNYSTTGV